MCLQAAFATLLSRYSGQDDILIGFPNANRNHLGTEELIGFFVNNLVLRCDLAADPPFETLLSQVRHTALAAFSNQDVPFDQIIDVLKPNRSLSYSPLFQIGRAHV